MNYVNAFHSEGGWDWLQLTAVVISDTVLIFKYNVF